MSYLFLLLAGTLQAHAATQADIQALLPAVRDTTPVDVRIILADPPDPDYADADPPDPDLGLFYSSASATFPYTASIDKTLTLAFDEATTGIVGLDLVDAKGRWLSLDGGPVAVGSGNFEVVAILGDGRDLFVTVNLKTDGILDTTSLVGERTTVDGYAAAVEIDFSATAKSDASLYVNLGFEDADGPIAIR